MGAEDVPRTNAFKSLVNGIVGAIDGPITWFRESIVQPNQQKYSWYHQKFRRVPTIDQCYTDDRVCKFEADQQFKRDRLVDNEVLSILRQRFEDCMLYEGPDGNRKCRPLYEIYQKGAENWFTKYGDLGFYGDSKAAYMKQKHRMLWERRHGPVGSGMKGEAAHHEE